MVRTLPAPRDAAVANWQFLAARGPLAASTCGIATFWNMKSTT